MATMLHAMPFNFVIPHHCTFARHTFVMGHFYRDGSKRCPVKPDLSLRSLTTDERSWFIIGRNSFKSPACFVRSSSRQFLLEEFTTEAADFELADSSCEELKTCSESQSATSYDSLLCWNLVLRSRLALAKFLISSMKGLMIDRSWVIGVTRIFGRLLLVGLMFMMLDFSSGRTLSWRVHAASAATVKSAERKTKGQETVGSGVQFTRDGRENTGEKLEGSTGLEDRSEDTSELIKKLIEKISMANLNEVEAHLKVLVQEEKLLRTKIDRAIDDYLSAKAKMDGLSRGAATVEKGCQEALLKEKAEVLHSYRIILSEIDMASKKIWERMKQIDTERKSSPAQRRPFTPSNIAQDLDQYKAFKSELNLFALATKVGEVARMDESTEILGQLEKEQKKSVILRDALERLMVRQYDPAHPESPELEHRLREARQLMLDEPGWEDEGGETEPAEDDEVQSGISAKELERILAARDRVLNDTWFDEKRKRWEMNPSAALYVAENNLAGHARVRQDWAVMFISLKGDQREYAVDLKAFQEEYEREGGSKMLYLKLIASGIPAKVDVMRIPLHERDVQHLVQLPFKIVWVLLKKFWNSGLMVAVKPWYYKVSIGAIEELMVRFGFPLIQGIVPQKMRVRLGFELAEGAEAAEPTDIIRWQQEAQKHVDARYGEGTGSPVWWVSLPVRCYLVGVPLMIFLQFVLGVLWVPFGPLRLEMNDVVWKEKKQEELEKKLQLKNKDKVLDPIKNVFDNMKRVKRPDVRLKDFAGIDMIKEEINEIIRFLKDPKLFKEIGARAPQGVLIVGESGTGKTTLALAIAAEARVPMVELQGSELEGGAWVGQGASNVRELFKTAREMAPLIIFMDDFDHFAGVRGATSDTRKHDHESLINQLLVELDGFETQEGVVLIATTSRPFAIDEALRRPGRMDRTIQLPMPNKQEREQILLQAAQRTMDSHLINYVDWSKVAEKTAGLTPSRLRYVPEGLEGRAVSYKIVDEEELLFYSEILTAIHRRSPRWIKESKWTKWYNNKLIDWLGLRVTKENMEAAVEYLDVYGESKPGIELFNPDYVWTREFKFPHAVWVAGKGLVTLLLPNFDSVDLIWLDPTSWEGLAFIKVSKRIEGGYEETGTITRSYCEKELVSYFGAFVAARMLLPFGENNNLCEEEMKKAHETATRMVLEWGWAPDDSPMVYVANGSEVTLAMGDQHEQDAVKKVNQLLIRACEIAAHMLERNRLVLEAMLEHILEFDFLDNQEIKRILDEQGAVFEKEPFSLLPYTRNEIVGVSTNGTGRSGKESPVSVT